MSRVPLLILFSVLTLGGCSSQSGTGGGGGGGGGGDLGPVDPDPGPVFPSTGLPDQNSFSVSVSEFNPRARNFDGTAVTLTARLADQLGRNTTIPDGTEVFWATDGGSIEPSCITTAGACTVTWTSQNPRPAAGGAIPDPLGSADTIASHSSGRATILVWTLGTESFIDNNSNGLFDDNGSTPDVQIDDLPEAFIDKNENGVRDANEEFVNYPLTGLGTGGGTYDGADGDYAGPNCAHSTSCASDQSVFNFLNIELAMSSDSICIVPVDLGPGYWDSNVTFNEPVDLKNDRSTFNFLIHDCFGNPPMSGTTVSFSSAVGELFADDGTVGNTNVDMGVAVTGTSAPIRERYPLNSLVYSASIVESLNNMDPEIGALELEISNGAGTFGTFILLSDPAM